MTPAERMLWEELRGNKLGIHFRRQQVIAGYIVDFFCHKADLVIEVDGKIHDKQKEEDANRDKVLTEMGLRVVRFRNEELEKDLAGVVERIRELISKA
jgi:very-short-patch-repair endonuclease